MTAIAAGSCVNMLLGESLFPRGFGYGLEANHRVAGQAVVLIFPSVPPSETILPDTATPSAPVNENSPLVTGNGGENVSVAESHVKLASWLFRTVNRKGMSEWRGRTSAPPSGWAAQNRPTSR